MYNHCTIMYLLSGWNNFPIYIYIYIYIYNQVAKLGIILRTRGSLSSRRREVNLGGKFNYPTPAAGAPITRGAPRAVDMAGVLGTQSASR